MRAVDAAIVPDVAIDDTLLRAVLAGDAVAERTLLAELAPRIEHIVRAHPELRRRGLASLPDDVYEVRIAALERLARDGYKNLARYLEQQEAGGSRADFETWLYGAVDFTVRDHLRKRFGRAPKADPGAPKEVRPSKRDLETLAGRFDDEQLDRSFVRTLGATRRLTANAIFEHMAEHFSAHELLAMRMFYLEDQGFGAIAEALGLPDERAADKLIRKLNARLRYKFAEGAGEA